MTDTANLALPFIDGSQAQKHVTHNEALRIMDAAIQIGVVAMTLTAPPPTPADGERHVVAGGAGGAWAGQAKNIAVWEDGAWRFLAPKSGWLVWSAADDNLFVFDGAGWNPLIGGGSPILDNAPRIGINSVAADPNLLSVHANASLFNSIDSVDDGTGDARIQISKEASTNVASIVFSDAFSGRAEFGLVGSDDFKLKVSDDGTTFVEAFTIDQTSGNLSLPRGVALSGVMSPPQITSNQNNYNPDGIASAFVLQISSDASRVITGLAGGAEGRIVCILNVGSESVTLADESASSLAANRFSLGSDIVLATKQAAILRYDETAARWFALARPAVVSSGGSGGLADSDRQNILLDRLYQSKLFGGYRRFINAFADGYKATDGIDGSSTNVDTTSAASLGFVKPTSSAATTVTGSAVGASGALSPSCYIERAYSLTSSVTVQTVGSYLGVAVTGGVFIAREVSTTSYDILQVESFSHPGGGWFDYTLQTPFAVPGTGTYRVGMYINGAITSLRTAAIARASKASVPPAVANGTTGWTADTGSTIPTRFSYGAIPNSMSLVTVPQTSDASVSNGRVLIEYDNADTITLNTDLTVEVTCNGGANWTAAALSAASANSQSGRRVVETADQPCASGTSFAARIKTFNSKNVPIRGVSLSVH